MNIFTSILFITALNSVWILPSCAIQLVINEKDRDMTVSNLSNTSMGAIVNCNGARLDLRNLNGHMVVNGNGNRILLNSCESLTLNGTGNSVDILQPSKSLMIRQAGSAASSPTELSFPDTKKVVDNRQ